jgi:outer membrane protein TolC
MKDFVTVYSSLFLLLMFLFGCTSEPIQIDNMVVEPPLEEVSGVTTKMLEDVRKKKELNLFDLYTLAVKSNERLAVKFEKVRQAEAKRAAAWGMFLPTISYRNQKTEFYPNLNATAKENRDKGYIYSALGVPNELLPALGVSSSGGGSLPPTFRSGHRLVVHIPIFTGLSEYGNVLTAKTNIRLAKVEMSKESMLLFTDLGYAYYSVLLLSKIIVHKNTVLKLNQNLIAEYKKRVNLGQARATELAGAHAKKALVEAEILTLTKQKKQGLETIAFLCNLDKEPVLLDNIEFSEPAYSLEQALTKLEDRMDIQAAKSALGIAKDKAMIAKGGFLPNVYIDGIYNLPQSGSKANAFAQFVFEIPLFSGGRMIFEIEETNSIKREATLFLSHSIRSGKDEILKNYSNYHTGKEELSAYSNALALAEKSYKLMQTDFKNKLVNFLELSNSLAELTAARENYDRVVLQNKLNRVLLGISVSEFPWNANHQKELEN